MLLILLFLIPETLGQSRLQPGPGVCVVEVVNGKKFNTDTEQFPPRPLCGTRIRIQPDCCGSFRRVPGYPGCAGLDVLSPFQHKSSPFDITDITHFVQQSTVPGILKKSFPSSAIVLFAVSNKVLQSELEADPGLRHEFDPSKKHKQSLTEYLVHPNIITNGDMENNQLLKTFYPGAKLRVSKRRQGEVFINCHRVMVPDYERSSGLVNFLDGLPRIPKGNIVKILRDDGRFNTFLTLLRKADLLDDFRCAEPLTVFAPTDAAFKKLHKHKLASFLDDEDTLTAILNHHTISNSVCSRQILAVDALKSREGSPIVAGCANHGITIDGHRLSTVDTIATNGIVHAIDDVLLPPRAQDILTVARKSGLLTFANMAEETGLDKVLGKKGPHTIFVPTDEAFAVARLQQGHLLTDSDQLRELLKFHVAIGRHTTSSIVDDASGPSLHPEFPLRLRITPHAATEISVESSCWKIKDIQAGNGVIHTIDKVLIPPGESILEIIRKDPRLSFLRDALNTAHLEKDLDELFPRKKSDLFPASKHGGHITLLAPTNEAFARLGPSFHRLVSNVKQLRQVLRYHMQVKMNPTCLIRPGLIYPFKTLEGSRVFMRREGNAVVANNIPLVAADIVATNGIIHVINGVLDPLLTNNGRGRALPHGIV